MLTIYKTLYNLSLKFKCNNKEASTIICECPFITSVNFLIKNASKILNKNITEYDIPFGISDDKVVNSQYQICQREPNKDRRVDFQLNRMALASGIKEYQKLFQEQNKRKYAKIYIHETARIQAASQLYEQYKLRYEDLLFLQNNINSFYRACCVCSCNINESIQNEDNKNLIINLKRFCDLVKKFKAFIDAPLILKQIEDNVEKMWLGLSEANLEIPPDLYLFISESSTDVREREDIRNRIICLAREIYKVMKEKKDGTYDNYLRTLENFINQ